MSKSLQEHPLVPGPKTYPPGVLAPPMPGQGSLRGMRFATGEAPGAPASWSALDLSGENHPKDQAQKGFNFGVVTVTFFTLIFIFI